jgi:hypothetical protein
LRKIERNTPDEEWSIRFTAAMAYLDLASGNDNDRQDMLDRAYRLLWGNVANLAQRQSALINDYFTPIREPQNADKQQKQAYQRLKKAREKELPPLDVPFYTNYYALTGVMDLLNIGEQERHTLDAIVRDATIILHARRNYVGFSTEEDWYLYNCSDTQMSYSTFNLFSDWNYVTMPSCLLTNDARIDIEVYAGLFPWDERNEFKFVQDAFQIYREENIEWKVEKLNWERLTWEELILEGLIREGPEFEKYIREELKGNVNIDFRMFKHAKNARGEYIFMDMTEQTVKLAVRPKQQIKDNFDKFIIEFIIHDAVGVYIVTFYKEKKGDATEFFGVLKVK